MTTVYGYDPASRLNDLTLTAVSASNEYKFSYTPADEIAQKTISNVAFSWTGAVAVNRNYTANGLNQYSAITGIAAPTYDVKGNLTSAGGNTYSFAAENDIATQVVGSSTWRFYYDPLHRMVGSTQVGEQFQYDGAEMVAEYNTAGTLLRRYVFGPGTDEPLLWYEGSGTTTRRYLMADNQGSIVAVTNGNTGNIIATNTYDEYGILASSNEPNAGRYRYTGQQWVSELGMYNYKARIYSPTLGRFLQTDPIGTKDQINLYAYVADDPVNKSDPTGQNWWGDFWNGVREFLQLPSPDDFQPPIQRGNKATYPDKSHAKSPYVRPSGSTTPNQRASVQGKQCARCGGTSTPMVAGHKKALVEEYHETGTIDKQRMRNVDAVRPECKPCSDREGAQMSRYSRAMNRTIRPAEAAATEGESTEAAIGIEQALQHMEDDMDAAAPE